MTGRTPPTDGLTPKALMSVKYSGMFLLPIAKRDFKIHPIKAAYCYNSRFRTRNIDVYRRQNLTYKDYPRVERVKDRTHYKWRTEPPKISSSSSKSLLYVTFRHKRSFK